MHRVSLDACFSRELWPRFRFFALIKPEKDIFPVRAAYDKKRPEKLNIGVNFVSSEKQIWFAGPDVIASYLLTGKMPHIVRAFKVVPQGRQGGMKSVNLLGSICINPNKDDFFRRIIEQRKANESNKILKHGLKVIANSGAYGIWVQLDERHEYKKILLQVFSGEHQDEIETQDREAEGPWYFPPVAHGSTAMLSVLLRCTQKMAPIK
jgi:hypothetical protein